MGVGCGGADEMEGDAIVLGRRGSCVRRRGRMS